MTIRKNLLSSILISLLTALTICIPLLDQYLRVMQRTEQSVEDGFVYYDLQHEDNPINKSIAEFKNIYDSLLEEQNKGYQYYELYTQYLGNYDEDKSYFDGISEELVKGHKYVNAVQIGKNIIAKSNMKLDKGRLFENKDYTLSENNIIPIIMGYSYSTIYEINDILELNYLFDTYQFKVIGFLMEGTKIEFASKNILLDEYIVMPSFNISADTEITDGLKIHYANKTSGVVQIEEDYAEIFHKDVEPLLIDKSVGAYSWTASPMNQQFKEIFGLGINGIKICIWIITMSLVIVNIFLIYKSARNSAEVKATKKQKVIWIIFMLLMTSIFYCAINFLYMILFGIFLFRIFHFILIFIGIGIIFQLFRLSKKC